MSLRLTPEIFDVPPEVAWFNTAYMGITPRPVTEALQAAALRKASPWLFTPDDFFTEADNVRHLAAGLFDAATRDIAIVPSVSYAMTSAAAMIGLALDEEIILLADQFPSNVYPWQRLARDRGGRTVTLMRRTGQSWTEAVIGALTRRTRIVAIPQMHWLDGVVCDIAAIRDAAPEGTVIALDLTQSLGALPFSVTQGDPDFAVAATYKWLLGPYALGLFYVAPRWQGHPPLEENWITRANARDFARLTEYTAERLVGAVRFDMGERSNLHTLPGLIAALELITHDLEHGLDDALSHQTAGLADALVSMGLTVEPAALRAGHYLSIHLPDGTPDDLTARLAQENIFVSRRANRLRITGHLHIRQHDIERLLAALSRHLPRQAVTP